MKFNAKTLFILLIGIISFSKLQSQNIQLPKSNFIYRLKELNDSTGKINYRHVFTYDEQGRPLSHTYDYFQTGKLYSSSKFNYTYNTDGKLTSQNSDKLNYSYFYYNNTLNKITLKILVNNNWELCEETLLNERQSGNQKIIHFQLNKRNPLNKKFDSLKQYADIEYVMDSSNNVLQSTIYAYNYAVLKEPTVYFYNYDNKPNPLQNIFIERWYQYDIENGGLTNVTGIKRKNDVHVSKTIYAYNDAGYPISASLNNYKFKKYKYELIEMPSTKQTPQKSNNPQKQLLTIYPNPASINFNIKAEGLTEGQAILRIFDISTGRAIKQITYNVTDKLEALITTNGLPAGIYLIELTNKNSVLKQKLIVK